MELKDNFVNSYITLVIRNCYLTPEVAKVCINNVYLWKSGENLTSLCPLFLKLFQNLSYIFWKRSVLYSYG